MESKHKSIIGIDYGAGTELRVLASILKAEGRFEVRETQSFSQIYGIKAHEVRDLVTSTAHRRLTLNYLKTFRAVGIHIQGLRKAKSKAMLEALIHGHYDNGNHFMTCYGHVYHFYYRGTLIAKWDAVNGQTVTYVHAGDFEGTASTKNQRKEIEKAVTEFQKAIFSL